MLPVVIAWALVGGFFAVGAFTINGFASRGSISSMLILASILGIASAGQTLVVVLGGLDLSIAALMTLADVAIPQLLSSGWNIVATLATVIAVAMAIGAWSGFVSRWLVVHPLIITLGVGFMVDGGLLAWTKGAPNGSAPVWLTRMVSAATHMGPVPFAPIVVVWFGVAVVTLVLAHRTRFGRQLYALGSNPSAAEFVLIRPRLIWTCVFAFSGLTAAVAGIMLSGFTGYGDVSSGNPYLFDTVAAVVVGGTSLLGGRGSYLQTIAGTLILTELSVILVGYGVSPDFMQTIFGALIIGFVVLYGRESHVRARV